MQQTVAHEFKPIDKQILAFLVQGDNVPSNIGDEVGTSRQWASQRLQQLESADIVSNRGRGVYHLHANNVPEHIREDIGLAETNQSDEDGECQAAKGDLKRALEHREWSAVEDAAARLGVETDE